MKFSNFKHIFEVFRKEDVIDQIKFRLNRIKSRIYNITNKELQIKN